MILPDIAVFQGRDTMGLVVALTGGIGSGKSTVANAFSKLNVPIIDVDILAREAVAPGSEALLAITQHFGRAILHEDGSLHRRQLREIIFHNATEKKWLEALLHPIIRHNALQQIAKIDAPYVIWVVPLLIENHLQNNADRILVVDVTPEVQLNRAMLRDATTLQHIKDIIATQVSREERLRYADDIIDNNGDITAIQPQITRLHHHYLELAQLGENNRIQTS